MSRDCSCGSLWRAQECQGSFLRRGLISPRRVACQPVVSHCAIPWVGAELGCRCRAAFGTREPGGSSEALVVPGGSWEAGLGAHRTRVEAGEQGQGLFSVPKACWGRGLPPSAGRQRHLVSVQHNAPFPYLTNHSLGDPNEWHTLLSKTHGGGVGQK